MLREFLLSAILAIALSDPEYGHGGHGGGYGGGHGGNHNHHAPAKYSFAYGVKDHYGPNFGHAESRDGYTTKGGYYVHLPDGRIQKVSYHVDKWGYHPVVSYSGKAHFPSHGGKHSGGYH